MKKNTPRENPDEVELERALQSRRRHARRIAARAARFADYSPPRATRGGSVEEMEVMTTVYVIALAMVVLGAGVVGWLWYAAYHAPFEPEQERIAAWLDAAAAGDPVAIAGVRRILADAAERSGLDAEALFAEYPLSRATREALSTFEDTDLTRLAAVNPHDDGYDLVPGGDVTNARIGHVYWDNGGLDAGLVLALDSGGETNPQDADEARDWLARRGYALDAGSVADIAALEEAH